MGTAVAGIFGAIFKITDVVPHGGPIVGVLGATNNFPLFIIAILLGTAAGVVALTALQKRAISKGKANLD